MTQLENILFKCFKPVIRFLQFWNREPDATHCFDMMELIFVLGGVRCRSTHGLVRSIWYAIQLLSVFQVLMAWLNVFDQILNINNVANLVCCVLMATTVSFSMLSGFLINRYVEPLQSIQDFISSQKIKSMDPDFDFDQRDKFSKTIVRIFKVVVPFSFIQQAVVMIPNEQRNQLFAIPTLVTQMGPVITSIAQFGLICMFGVIWFCKYFSCFWLSAMLLMGLRVEMRILHNRFNGLHDRVESLVTEQGFFSHNPIDQQRSHAELWRTLKKEVSEALDQHLELLKILYTFRPFMGNSFMMRYYHALYFIASLLFLATRMGTMYWFVSIGADVALCLLEVSCWCYLVESLMDTHESMGMVMFDICFKLPHCSEHHLDYIRTKTDLVIIGLNTYQSQPMKYAAIFEINMDRFVKLANTVYTVLTFLFNMQ